MGDLTANRLWDNGSMDCPSQYARMIPGVSAMPHPRIAAPPAPTAEFATGRSVAAMETAPIKQTRWPTRQFLRQPTGDQFMLCQLVGADLSVLSAVCGAWSLFYPSWGLPWACVPVFAVLVTLFGFAQGLYRDTGDAVLAAAPVLARSTLFALALVSIAAWGEMRPLAAITIFASSFNGLVLWRWLRRSLGSRSRRETELRRVLIVGGGIVARARRISRRILMLHQGRIYADQTPDEIFKSTDPVIHRFVNGIAEPIEKTPFV